MDKKSLRNKILELVRHYGELESADNLFVAGSSPVPPSGKVYDSDEMESLVDASLDFWLTTGRFNAAFEKEFAKFVNGRYVLTTNSGSSANLLAFAALTSPALEERAVRAGDEMITVAAGFPTTVNPALLYGVIPVFVDIEIPTYNIDVKLLEEALSEKTKAIMIAHTLGNPFNLDKVKHFAEKHNLWLVEDCCDALGSKYRGKMVGSFGDLATCSFYPAHHITMGEGGAVFTRNSRLKRIVESIRDWGRDCYCDPGNDNTCKKRFDWQLGQLPHGYDHKYIYSHTGYNLKITDMQAAVGLAQLKKLPEFISKRKENFDYLKANLSDLDDVFWLPEATEHSEPSWFGFPITIRPDRAFERVSLLRFLDANKIGTRLLFAGNLTRQPYFENINFRVAGSLETTDLVMNNTFWVGCYPGLDIPHLDHIVRKLHQFVQEKL